MIYKCVRSTPKAEHLSLFPFYLTLCAHRWPSVRPRPASVNNCICFCTVCMWRGMRKVLMTAWWLVLVSVDWTNDYNYITLRCHKNTNIPRHAEMLSTPELHSNTSLEWPCSVFDLQERKKNLGLVLYTALYMHEVQVWNKPSFTYCFKRK